jgi:hypothetical protein
MDQMWSKKNLKGFVWNFKGVRVRFEDEREKNEREKIINDTKPDAYLAHMPLHHIKGT